MRIVKTIMKIAEKIALLFCIAIAENTFAFDTSTHAAMTAAAAGKSKLGISPSSTPLLGKLGLRDNNFILTGKWVRYDQGSATSRHLR